MKKSFIARIRTSAPPSADVEGGAKLAEAVRSRRDTHHALLQICLLESGLLREPAALLYDRVGKPRVKQGPHVSLSRSRDLGVVGICRDTEIGVDIEAKRVVEIPAARSAQLREIAKMVDPESPGGADPTAFLRRWVRLEAAIKCYGTTLSSMLQDAERGSLFSGNTLDRMAWGNLRMIEFEVLECYVGAVALKGLRGKVQRTDLLDDKKIHEMIVRWGTGWRNSTGISG